MDPSNRQKSIDRAFTKQQVDVSKFNAEDWTYALLKLKEQLNPYLKYVATDEIHTYAKRCFNDALAEKCLKYADFKGDGDIPSDHRVLFLAREDMRHYEHPEYPGYESCTSDQLFLDKNGRWIIWTAHWTSPWGDVKNTVVRSSTVRFCALASLKSLLEIEPELRGCRVFQNAASAARLHILKQTDALQKRRDALIRAEELLSIASELLRP